MRLLKRLKPLFFLCLFGVIAVVVMLPFASVFLNSLARPESLAGGNSKLLYLPFPIGFRQYKAALFHTRETVRFFWNTVIVTLPTIAGGIGFAVLSGYGLAKFNFPFKKVLFFTYIMVMLLPIQIQLVGTYMFYDKIGLLGSYIGVILPGAFSPFGAFLIYQFMKNVPYNTMESGRLDGANELVLFVKIVIPQVKSGIASMLMLMLIDCWNMVEMPMTLLGDEARYPLSIMLSNMKPSDSATPSAVYASTIIFTIPILLVFFLAGDSLTEGIERSNFIN